MSDNIEVIYIGDRKSDEQKSIYILHTPGHYDCIKTIKAFLVTDYFCDFCKKSFTIGKHYCQKSCSACHRSAACIKVTASIQLQTELTCEFCKVICSDQHCYDLHLKYVCITARKCDKCNDVKKAHGHHVCINEKYCSNCKIVVNLSHQCFILTSKQKNEIKNRKNKKFFKKNGKEVQTTKSKEVQREKDIKYKEKKCKGFIFFDYEAFVNKDGVHQANLVIASRVCQKCLSKENCLENCKLMQFETNEEFCDWLFTDFNKGFTAIAHYFKGYDGMYILQYIYKVVQPKERPPEVIFDGSKINYLLFRDIRFVDSLNFLPMSLEKFSGTFGITELKKGFFPHLFNKEENFNYISVWPEKKYYNPDSFSESKKNQFDLWYDENKYKTFNFKEELKEYCISDVKLLQEGCLSFRAIIMEISDGIDPFAEVITLASTTMALYQKCFMPENSIGIIPDKGYNAEQTQSKQAIMFMNFLMNKEKILIKNSLNGGEIILGPYRIDGYCEETNTFYEYHGCYWHGCPKCFSSNLFCKQRQQCYFNIYNKHVERIYNIKKLMEKEFPGSKLIEMWECEFKYEKKHNENLQKYLNEYQFSEPINPRDSLFGGRTNSLKLYHKCEENEKAYYYDFCSLYPYVMKYSSFPIGHPIVITENFEDINNYFGVIKCTILPPQNIFHPVLPQHGNGKLMFVLCSKCGKDQLSECIHDEKDRALTGTWVTEEVKIAIENGYKIIKIHEVWHYANNSVYDKNQQSEGLFSKQINMLLKIKQEASGWPEDVESDEQKDEYISKYYDHEGNIFFITF